MITEVNASQFMLLKLKIMMALTVERTNLVDASVEEEERYCRVFSATLHFSRLLPLRLTNEPRMSYAMVTRVVARFIITDAGNYRNRSMQQGDAFFCTTFHNALCSISWPQGFKPSEIMSYEQEYG